MNNFICVFGQGYKNMTTQQSKKCVRQIYYPGHQTGISVMHHKANFFVIHKSYQITKSRKDKKNSTKHIQ